MSCQRSCRAGLEPDAGIADKLAALLARAEALLKEPGYPSLTAFVASVHAQQPRSRLPREHRWQNAGSGLHFHYRLEAWYRLRRSDADQPLDCARGRLTFDGRAIAAHAFDDLLESIELNLCREHDGGWRINSRWAS